MAHFERRFVTPEGIDLRLQIATGGQRAGAFMLDAVIMIVSLLIFSFLVGLVLAAFGLGSIEYAAIVWLLGFFVLRNGYFIAFELGERAATPGKRATGIRVVARNGGRLTGDAVIARNMLREVEIFLPLSFLGYQAGEGTGGALTTIVGLAWALLFAFFPLFNRDRLRAGDMIAGTWVVEARRSKLGRNLVAEADANQNRIDFTDEQLDAYGVFELQTLEQVLRQGDPAAMGTVAETIQGKIGWRGGRVHDYDFLSGYYAALRARLERNLLFGKRREDKWDRSHDTNTLHFTDQQLSVYGEIQLLRLREVLRTPDAHEIAETANRIRAKIGWTGDATDHHFLTAYEAALRKRIGRGVPLGKRGADIAGGG